MESLSHVSVRTLPQIAYLATSIESSTHDHWQLVCVVQNSEDELFAFCKNYKTEMIATLLPFGMTQIRFV